MLQGIARKYQQNMIKHEIPRKKNLISVKLQMSGSGFIANREYQSICILFKITSVIHFENKSSTLNHAWYRHVMPNFPHAQPTKYLPYSRRVRPSACRLCTWHREWHWSPRDIQPVCRAERK